MKRHYRLVLASLVFVSFSGRAFAGDKPWIEVDSPHFRVLSDGSDKDARRVASAFEQIRAVLADHFPNFRLESGAPLLVLAARNEDTAKKLAPELWKGKGAKPAGYFQHGWEKQFAMVRLDTVAPETYEVVYHEYVHTVMHLNFRWLPLWLDEGLAEFYGNSRLEHGRTIIGAPTSLSSYLKDKSLIPLDTLLAVTPGSRYYHDEDLAQMFYAESWALVHFLTFGPGMSNAMKLSQFNTLLQQGTEQKKAFQQVFGDTAELEKKLDDYVHRLAFIAGAVNAPEMLNQKEFAVRTLSVAETESQLGSYHLWSRRLGEARRYIEQAVKDDPKLGLAHESMGFLDFEEGKDEQAAREFSQAYELDNSLYLSLFYKTMLSGILRSDNPNDQASLHDVLLKTLDLNPQFAPAFVEIALLDIRQDKFSEALAVARRAEQLEPARAGYHLLSSQILLRLGRGTEASEFARYVAARWFGPDHDEAVALWSQIPDSERGQGDPLSDEIPKDTQTIEGRVHSTTCPGNDRITVVVDRGDRALTFHGKFPFMSGFSDTIWYGEDHFTVCRHLEGLHAVVRFRPAVDGSYAGEIAELELREELPEIPQANPSRAGVNGK
jgi:Tfp pilus assembly protein PilF